MSLLDENKMKASLTFGKRYQLHMIRRSKQLIGQSMLFFTINIKMGYSISRSKLDKHATCNCIWQCNDLAEPPPPPPPPTHTHACTHTHTIVDPEHAHTHTQYHAVDPEPEAH